MSSGTVRKLHLKQATVDTTVLEKAVSLRQSKRVHSQIRQLRTYLGRVVCDIEHKLNDD